MSYKYSEIQGGHKLSEMTEQEQTYVRNEWERLCNRGSVNSSERVFFKKANGVFFEATRQRIAANRYCGCAGGYWAVRYGNCKHWAFKKNVFGQYDPEQANKYFSGLRLESGEIITVPSKVHTKKDVLELAKKLGFEF